MRKPHRTIPTDPLDTVIPPASTHLAGSTASTAAKHIAAPQAASSTEAARQTPLSVYLSLDDMEELHRLLWAVRKVTGKRLSMSDYARLSMSALKPRLRAIAKDGKQLSADEVARIVGTQVSE